MIALVPEDRELDRLALEGGESRDELHLTLMFLGEDEDWPEEARESVREHMNNVAHELTLLEGNAFGAAVWNPDGQDPCVVLNIGGTWLHDVQVEARQAVHNVSHGPDAPVTNVPEQHQPWSPHITLAYDTSRLNDALSRLGPVMFDRIRVVWGDEPVDFDLGSGSTIPFKMMTASGEVVLVPYRKVHNHGGCPSSKPWAVINSQTGDVKGCHASEEKANAQLGILARVERGEKVPTSNTAETFQPEDGPGEAAPPGDGGDCPPGHHRMPNGDCMPDTGMNEDVTEFDDNYWTTVTEFDDGWGLETLQGLDAESRRRAAGTGAALGDGSFPIRNCGEVEKAVHAMNRPTNNSKETIRRHIVKRAKALGCTSHLPSTWPSSTKKAAAVDVEEPTPDGGDQLVTAFEDDRWHGVLAVEGVPTGDGREFAPGALEWRNLPLSLYWQRQTADGHAQSVIVGSIENIWRDGSAIRATGRFNLNAPENGQSRSDAWDAYQLVRDGFMRGVSVTLDDMSDNDVEMVWPEPEEGEEAAEDANPLAALFSKPEKVIFHHGRIIDGTLTGQPALQEAFIACGPYEDTGAELAMSVVVPAHSSGTTDGAWDVAANLRNLGPLSAELVAHSFAWVRGTAGERPTRSDCMFLHHEVSDDGKPGLANLTACAAAIGMLNGARGGANIPVQDRQGVYDHLAQHLRDAGREPQPLVSPEEAEHLALVAAAVMAPVAPPRAWFDDPNFDEITPLMVGDDGFIRGHLAKWGVCHTSFPGTCVTPPHEDDYSFFTTGEMVTREGVRVPVGQLTLGTGHAPAGLGARPASVHYDHTGYAVADVAAGADAHGIWVAGALCPDVDEITIRRLRASAISGDWRRIGGQLRLVAALVVNVPGFPIPRTKTRTQDGAQTALVASGIVTNVEPSPRSSAELSPRVAALVAEALEARVNAPIAARLADRVHAS